MNNIHAAFFATDNTLMEFSLTINQKQIHENFPVLDIKDAAIIDFLTRFSHAKKIKKRIIGADVYYWFDYGKIASENPLLKLDRESIRKRVRQICKLGILNAHPDNQGGEVYFAFGDNYEKTHRADLPEVEAQTSGKQSRTHRANNPELLAKHRANNPDNHNNHLSVNQDQGERTTPAPENPSNLQNQQKESGLVSAAENPETVKAEKKEKDFIPRGAAPADCDGSYGVGKIEFYPEVTEECNRFEPKLTVAFWKNLKDENFEVTAIASPTGLPGVTLVEAAPKIQPIPRVATTIEAETKIATWIAGEGIETVKHRFNIAKQRFDPDNAAALAAHYCSVYTKNPANKERLLKDPVTHFSDGLFSYLKNEESWGRNNAPKEGGQTRQTPPQNYTSSTRH